MSKNNCFPFTSQTCGITPNRLRQIAFQTGFCKRASGKIDASIFFSIFVRRIGQRNRQPQ